MKIATLFRNDAAERWVVPALAADGGTVLRHADLGGLMSTLRDDTVDAVILEDSPSDVHHWLLVLQSNDLRKLPIIVLGAGMAGGVATALHAGASDYAKITDSAEPLIARLRAHVQLHAELRDPTMLAVDRYSLDADTMIVSRGDCSVTLTPRELGLAWALFASHGQVVSIETLAQQVWGRPADISKRAIEQHVHRLRRRLADTLHSGAERLRIRAVYGVGYRLDLPRSE